MCMVPKEWLDDEQNLPFHIVHMTRGFLILCAYSKSMNALTNKFVLYNGVPFLFKWLARVVGPQYKMLGIVCMSLRILDHKM